MNAEEQALYEAALIREAEEARLKRLDMAIAVEPRSKKKVKQVKLIPLQKAISKMKPLMEWDFVYATEFDKLPDAMGLYVIRSNMQPIYVGCSYTSLRARFTGHNKRKELVRFTHVDIAYWQVNMPREDLFLAENFLIRLFNPCLNGVDL